MFRNQAIVSVILKDEGIKSSGAISVSIKLNERLIETRLPYRCSDELEILPSTILMRSSDENKNVLIASFYIRCSESEIVPEPSAASASFHLVSTAEKLDAKLLSYAAASDSLIKVKYSFAPVGFKKDLSSIPVTFLLEDGRKTTITLLSN